MFFPPSDPRVGSTVEFYVWRPGAERPTRVYYHPPYGGILK
jgi:hypothetical protein